MLIQFTANACDIVHRPLYRKLYAAISALLHIDKPERAPMDIDAGEKILPQLGRVLQKL